MVAIYNFGVSGSEMLGLQKLLEFIKCNDQGGWWVLAISSLLWIFSGLSNEQGHVVLRATCVAIGKLLTRNFWVRVVLCCD